MAGRGDHYSEIRIDLEPVGDGCRLKLLHSGVPQALEDELEKGWHTYYWEPLKALTSKNT